jgi:hypothetical protein
MEILSVILAIIGFGIECFKIGYTIGKYIA